MMFANTTDGRRAPIATGERGRCPACNQTVIAKCGPIYVNHWAHEADDCDGWAEPETAWHRSWKQRFPAERQEVILPPHRADVISAKGWVLEFQNSPLDQEQIRERERFYGAQLLWIVNGAGWAEKNLHFRTTHKHGPTQPNRTPVSFRWRWPRLRWLAARQPLFLDLDGETLLRVHWFSSTTPCGGWGTLTDLAAFAEWAETGTLPASTRDPLIKILKRQNQPATMDYHHYGYDDDGAAVYQEWDE